MTDRTIIEAHRSQVQVPAPGFVTGHVVIRGYTTPVGLYLDYMRSGRDLKGAYTSFVHSEVGVFCVLAVETFFSEN